LTNLGEQCGNALMSYSRSARFLSFGLLASACALTVASGCGSEDDKKESPGSGYDSGGDSGNAGGSSAEPEGGHPPVGSSDAGAGNDTTTGGIGNGGGQSGADGGVPSQGQAGAAGSTTDDCPEGFGDCDNDPGTCETPLDTLVQCGGCEISCSDTNGVVACEDSKCVMTACDKGFGDCNVDGTDGCELALAEDDTNCGECGRDCAAAGSVCDTSMCAPTTLDASASGFLSTFAGGAVYLMQSGAMPVSSYTLARIPVDGTARKNVWASAGNVGPGALLADEANVYWAVSGTPPSVLTKAADAASDVLPTVMFQPDAQPQFMAMQGANFYWANSTTGLIYARSKTAAMNVKGTAIVNVDQGTYSAFVASPSHLFFIVQNAAVYSLRMVAIPAGGTPTDVPDAEVTTSYTPLMTVGEKLYFVRRIGLNALNGLYSFTPGDATVQQLVAHDNINAFIVDDQAIYYKLGSDAHVYKVKLTGGVGVAITNGVGNGPFAGQDESYLYSPQAWGSNGPLRRIVK
jgi:hypothetical protein